MQRCEWVKKDNTEYENYHDTEWGIPVFDDQKHFEMIILEGAQAGLSWETILKRRKGYRDAFKNFVPKLVADMQDDELEALLLNPNIIRNRLKVYSTRKNAKVFLDIQKEFGSFNSYVWKYVNNTPQLNSPKSISELRATSPESDSLSKDLKKRGMSFVGSTIMYAYMQAVGLVNDHMTDCFCYKEN
ncbi:MAG: DNA-3-methyladenine glycosylase I [Legionellaceae bacterium]|nr:DNA-3-methyladenine glycosylase I [Legionellaceae bacterium]